MKGCAPRPQQTTPKTQSQPWWDTSPFSEEAVSEHQPEVVVVSQVSWVAKGEEGTAGVKVSHV